jgi:hypothetical protein
MKMAIKKCDNFLTVDLLDELLKLGKLVTIICLSNIKNPEKIKTLIYLYKGGING